MDKKGLKETLEVLEEGLIDLAKNLKPFFANFSTYRTAKYRELYLPKEWAEDSARCKEAYVPEVRKGLL